MKTPLHKFLGLLLVYLFLFSPKATAQVMPFGFFHAGSSNGTNNSNLVVEVTSATGRIWMDRNLGAMRAATSATDYQAYGSLYQFGRGSDGHQLINWTSATAGTPVN